jgi:ketosteroid isomerase-like protein
MTADLEHSAVEFTRMWCNLFVGDRPDIARAMSLFTDDAVIVAPGAPYRLSREADQEEIHFAHVVDGRGRIHFWQVLEPRAIVSDRTAVVVYYARYNIGRQGESTTRCARETLVLSREGEHWKIMHLHTSFVA